jgi:thiol-disulfide isomerase/thioredoxin
MRASLTGLMLFAAGTLLAGQETIISGKLLGFDRKPMPIAHAHILKLPNPKPIAQAVAKEDGSFEVRTRETGTLIVEFTGVNHRALDVPLIIEKPTSLQVAVTLQTYEYLSDFKEVTVLSDVTDFAFEKAERMTKQPDGSYMLTLQTPRAKVAYQLFGVEGTNRAINGTQSESYEFDDAGDYRSIVSARNGKARIVFDPRRLVRSSVKYSIVFRDQDHPVAKVALIQLGMLTRAELLASGRTDPKPDWSGQLKSIVAQLKAEKAALVRQALLLDYLDIAARSGTEGDPAIGTQALKEIPPDSKLWMAPTTPLIKVAGDLARDMKLYEAYLGRFIDKHPSESLKQGFLMNALVSAKMQGDERGLQQHYDLVMQHMGETPFGISVKQQFSRTLRIALGKTVPAFRVKALEDPSTVYTTSTFKGKAVLFDFWAVWCGPCVAEMENLHKAYERFKSKNFQILSLSLDQKPEDVRKFRADKWNMPWLHAFVTNDKELTSAFEVVAIPRPILVDADGKIVALSADLVGDQLEKTLEKFVR